MKLLQHHIFDPVQCRLEWGQFKALMIKSTLSERKDILPFFKARADLSLLICSYFPLISEPDKVAHEYAIDGDFVADLVVGDSRRSHFLLVEFEDGTPSSIFRKVGKKSTPSWAPRFEGAYSQLTDWLWKLEDKRSTADFANTFGTRRATFQGLIVIGKNMALADREKDRLKWRMDRTLIDSNAISVVSFDQLLDDLDHWLTVFHKV